MIHTVKSVQCDSCNDTIKKGGWILTSKVRRLDFCNNSCLKKWFFDKNNTAIKDENDTTN